ncbi:hypothetical protein H072_6915 [Dactylellina haptotyla CBS 200.50]|uniref:Uncharacterized protein n=1 Tax=Dactylellina haptotyla (strain CBS 200.50) TaxID=1284197 RepID=S8A8X4_DACHA|nr:hypothetical protein H072_6915 [Dactylellina haptotyla CBS 200.50]
MKPPTLPRAFRFLILTCVLGVYAPSPFVAFYDDIPFKPYWLSYVTQNLYALGAIGVNIDELYKNTISKCPVGKTTDPPEVYKHSLSYLLDALKAGQKEFDSILTLISKKNFSSQAALESFGFNDTRDAQAVHGVLKKIIADTELAKVNYQMYTEWVLNLPGQQYPIGSTAGQNLLRLSLALDSARVDIPNDLVKVPTTGREIFLQKWRNFYKYIAFTRKFSRASGQFILDRMDTEAANELLTGWLDPEDAKNTSELTYLLIMTQLHGWFGCWMRPVFNMINIATNVLGSVPDLSNPRWSTKSID